MSFMEGVYILSAIAELSGLILIAVGVRERARRLREATEAQSYEFLHQRKAQQSKKR